MSGQVKYENISVGMEIPPLTSETSSRMSAQWAAASGDYDPIHYDRNYALNQKLPDIIVNGRLKIALLGQMMTNWIGPRGTLKKIGASHRGMDNIGDPIVCRGIVIKKYTEDGDNIVECEVWIENGRGDKTSQGSAVVVIP